MDGEEHGCDVQLGKSGVPIDLTQLKPQQLETLVDHLDELTMELDDAESRIRIFCEWAAADFRPSPR